MSISRANPSGIFPASRSAHTEFETFISALPPLQAGHAGTQPVSASEFLNGNAPFCLAYPNPCPMHSPQKQKTHLQVVHRGGLPAIRSVEFLARDHPTHRRPVVTTTNASADLDFPAHWILPV